MLNHIFSHVFLILCGYPCFCPVALQALDPLRFQNITQTLDFRYQALANGVAQHAEVRRVEIEKKKLEKATGVAATAS